MKKLFILIALIVIAFNAQAVRHCNLVITGAALINGSSYHDSAVVPFRIRVKNLGPDSLKSTDTLAILLISWRTATHTLTSTNSFAYLTNHALHVGDSVTVLDSPGNLNLFYWQNWPHDTTHSICIYVTGLNRSADSVSGDTATNSEVCTAVTYLDVHKLAISRDGFKMYPNPAQSELNFEMTLNKAGNLSVRILDLMGRTVLTHDAGKLDEGYHSLMLNAGNLPNGMYIYQLLLDGEATTGRFSIAK